MHVLFDLAAIDINASYLLSTVAFISLSYQRRTIRNLPRGHGKAAALPKLSATGKGP
jgi:hypothetical protein